MPGGFGPRLAIEAGFLILLGVGAGLADLRSGVIVGLLAAGWVLVSVFELAVWRGQGRPAAPAVIAAPPEPEAEPEPQIGWQPEPKPHEPDNAYPLRADVGSTPSEEVEAYTRIFGGELPPEDEPHP